MTREEAIKILMGHSHTPQERAALEALIPELRESEDERIRKGIIEIIKAVSGPDCDVYLDEKKQEKYIAWLEKQKENPKSADSIPSDCVSDVKCEDRWHKVGDSLPDNPREVLCKDEAGNYFIGRYYVGEGWEISNYDDEDKPHHLNPPVSKWIDFPLEKQKEQKPWKVGANAYFTPEQKPEEVDESTKRLNDNWMKQHFDDYEEQKPAWSEEDEEMLEEIINHIDTTSVQRIPARPGSAIGKSWIKFLKSLRPQPKQEWSEEDVDMLNSCISSIEEAKENRYAYKETDGDTSYDYEIAWLKSLRPQSQGTYKQIVHSIYDMLKDKDFFEIQPSHRVSLLNDIRVKCKIADECAEILDEPHWKPSEHQMNILQAVKEYVGRGSGYWGEGLGSLIEDLKKLM